MLSVATVPTDHGDGCPSSALRFDRDSSQSPTPTPVSSLSFHSYAGFSQKPSRKIARETRIGPPSVCLSGSFPLPP